MEKRRVVITGAGALTPIGRNAPESWAAARAGVCGVAPITLYDAGRQKVRLAAEVKHFVPEDCIDKRDVRKLDRFAQTRPAAVCWSPAASAVCPPWSGKSKRAWKRASSAFPPSTSP